MTMFINNILVSIAFETPLSSLFRLKTLGWALAGFLAIMSSPAAEKYVIPDGAAPYDGTSWASAYSNLQDAVNACWGEESTIYLRYGVYSNAAQISISNAVNLTIRGGFQGTGLDLATTPTILTKPAGIYRVLFITNSTITLDRLMVTNGYAPNGAGIYLVNSQTTITNCVVSSNRISATSARGGGIYIIGGALTILNSRLTHNSSGYHLSGGGLSARNALVILKNSSLLANSWSGNASLAGGGFYLDGGSAFIETCYFASNYVTGNGSFRGGALFTAGASSLVVSNSIFVDNYSSAGGGREGSSILLSGTGTASVHDCEFKSTINPGSFQDVSVSATGPTLFRNALFRHGTSNAISKGASGSLAMTNSLLYGYGLSALVVTGGTVSIGNCTIADNGEWGISNSVGTVSVKNCIVWGNTAGGLQNVSASYSCLQEAQAGECIRTDDPKFMDAGAGNYRLQSHSPAQDAGQNEGWMASAFDLAGDKRLQGGVVDFGAYEAVAADAGIMVQIL